MVVQTVAAMTLGCIVATVGTTGKLKGYEHVNIFERCGCSQI